MVLFSRYTVCAVRGTEVAAVTTAYLALALWWLWPLPTVLATHSAYTASGPFADSQVADWYMIVWALAWGAHALATDPTRLFNANAFHPASLSLAYSEHFLGHQPLFAPAYWASGNAVLAVNVALVGPPPRALIAGRQIRLNVTVQNASTEAWPGWGLVPRHLLHLRACVTLRGAKCRTKLQPLAVDVPAGGTVTIPVTMTVPRLALGPCDLRLELWQLGDGPLERCGLVPLAIPVDVHWQRDARAPSGQGRGSSTAGNRSAD